MAFRGRDQEKKKSIPQIAWSNCNSNPLWFNITINEQMNRRLNPLWHVTYVVECYMWLIISNFGVHICHFEWGFSAVNRKKKNATEIEDGNQIRFPNFAFKRNELDTRIICVFASKFLEINRSIFYIHSHWSHWKLKK